jgi:hypothetical protein
MGRFVSVLYSLGTAVGVLVLWYVLVLVIEAAYGVRFCPAR